MHTLQRYMRPAVITPLAVGAGLGIGLVFGASAVAVSPATANAIGVAIASIACSSTSACVSGTNASTGPGVAGTSKSGIGASGLSTSSYGLIGKSTSGVGLEASSAGNSAIVALNDASSHSTISARQGGAGTAISGSARSGSGVSGIASSGAGLSGSSTTGSGVNGTSGSGYGVSGRSTISAAVFGSSTNALGVVGYGTFGGEFFGTAGDGVHGTESDAGAGVVGLDRGISGDAGTGVIGMSAHGNGGYFEGDGLSAAVVAKGGTTEEGFDLLAVFSSDDSKSLHFDDGGDLYISGSLYTDSPCPTCFSKTVRSYAPHVSEPTMEDVGKARLSSGSAYVSLDSAFRSVIDSAAAYAVFVTPEGESNGLFVAERSSRGFLVRENRGGRSTVAFVYRIVAKPFGKAEPRLPMLQIRRPPQPGSVYRERLISNHTTKAPPQR